MCVRGARERWRMSSTEYGSAAHIKLSLSSASRKARGLLSLEIEGRQKHEAFWTRRRITKSWMPIQPPTDDPRTITRGMESAWTRCKDIYVDGSGGGPTHNVELPRCRWAAEALHDRTDSSAAYMVGLLSGVKQKVPRRSS